MLDYEIFISFPNEVDDMPLPIPSAIFHAQMKNLNPKDFVIWACLFVHLYESEMKKLKKQLTKNDLIEKTKMTSGSVTTAIRSLKNQGLLIETSKNGEKAYRLKTKRDAESELD